MQKCSVQSLALRRRSVKWVGVDKPRGGLRQPEGRRLRARPHRMKDLSVWSFTTHAPTLPAVCSGRRCTPGSGAETRATSTAPG